MEADFAIITLLCLSVPQRLMKFNHLPPVTYIGKNSQTFKPRLSSIIAVKLLKLKLKAALSASARITLREEDNWLGSFSHQPIINDSTRLFSQQASSRFHYYLLGHPMLGLLDSDVSGSIVREPAMEILLNLAHKLVEQPPNCTVANG